MNSSKIIRRARCLLWALSGAAALAQNAPHIGYIYPAGGQQGTTFLATAGGRNLNATDASCSGQGVHATVLQQERQVTPSEQKELQETLSRIREKRQNGQRVTAAEAQLAEEIKQKLANFGRRLTNPSLGEFVTLKITVDPDAEPGNREIRLLTSAGFSNPLIFNVGELPEWNKKVWKDIPKAKGSMEAEIDPRPPVEDITLPVTVNGQIPPGGADRYRITADKGQQIVVTVRARELIPYIPDAVPGWFQAVVTLSDENGNELACIDDYQFNSDPVLIYETSKAGKYTLEIRDALYRGREDFVYRATIGGQLDDQAAGRSESLRKNLPETSETEPNDTPAAARTLTTPGIITGRINQSGDTDIFRFEGKKGEQIVAEVYARRINSPLDSLLILTDASGKQLTFNDDHIDKGSGLTTHHADSYLSFTLTETGAYFIQISDTQMADGEDFNYRLRVSNPIPDFELRVTPSSLNVHGGASTPVTVHALRKDGFTGEIEIDLKDAPKGFMLTGARIPENQDSIRFTLNAPAIAMEPFDLQFEGRALIEGRDVTRAAVPADDMMQAFSYRHLVPAQELKVAVTGRFRAGGDTAQILSTLPVKIPAGGTAKIRVHMPAGPMMDNVEFELSEPPDGITIQNAAASEIVIAADREKVKSGSTGNLIVNVFSESKETGRKIPLGSLPAIAYKITGESLL
jgi:hypothetical protein